MSNGDDAGEADAGEDGGQDGEEAAGGDEEETAPAVAEDPVAEIESQLDDAEASLEAAESEATLDGVESTLDDIESDIEAADLPEPDEDAEDEGEDGENPKEALETRLADLREDLEEKRGPYAEDVAETVREAASTLEEGTWTETGATEVREAVASFLMTADDHVGVAALPEDVAEEDDGDEPTYSLPAAVDALEETADAIESAGLDADDDEAAIAELLEAAESLQDDLAAAEEWSDLSMRNQLDALGFYDALSSKNRKDFPPEWSAIKTYGREENVEMLLAVLDKMGDADFMADYVFDALTLMGRAAAPAFDEMHQRAQKRNKPPIRILGKIGDDRACDTLHDFIDGDGDVALQKTTLRALGEIGSEDSTQAVADRLDADNPEIRSAAARSLGLIGDTRAIDPLTDVLADDDANEVRASAGWALRQIGTERALDELSEYADDRSYIVQAEAEKVAGV